MVKLIIQNWSQILFVASLIIGFIRLEIAYREGTKCSLRNDILQIYNQYRNTKQIPLNDFQAISMSYELYKKYKGNSFVDSIWQEVQSYKKI